MMIGASWFLARLCSSPLSPPASTPSNQTEDNEQHECSDESIDNQGKKADAHMDVQPRQQPVSYKSAQQANYQISDQTESCATHHLARQPTGNQATITTTRRFSFDRCMARLQ
jgi:hypothetical protein